MFGCSLLLQMPQQTFDVGHRYHTLASKFVLARNSFKIFVYRNPLMRRSPRVSLTDSFGAGRNCAAAHGHLKANLSQTMRPDIPPNAISHTSVNVKKFVQA